MSTLGMALYRRGTALLAGRGLRRFRLLNRLNTLVLRCVAGREALVLGHRMLLDPCDSLELSLRGIYEPFETRLAQELVPAGGCVVDVGANIGYYTLLCARRAGPTGRVIAFEPEPGNFSLLQRNLALNGYGNVQLEHAAVSDMTGALELFVSEENHGDHRTYATAADPRRRVAVRAWRLDDYFADDPPAIDLLKMDVQGGEGRVLAGMRMLLRTRAPRAILTEFWPLGLQRAGSCAAEVLEWLRAAGYRFARLDERTSQAVPVDAKELLANYTEENGHQTNLLARLD